jgi:hypothetical protein
MTREEKVEKGGGGGADCERDGIGGRCGGRKGGGEETGQDGGSELVELRGEMQG